MKYQHKDEITTETLCKVQERKEKKAAVNDSRKIIQKTRAQKAYTVLSPLLEW